MNLEVKRKNGKMERKGQINKKGKTCALLSHLCWLSAADEKGHGGWRRLLLFYLVNLFVCVCVCVCVGVWVCVCRLTHDHP